MQSSLLITSFADQRCDPIFIDKSRILSFLNAQIEMKRRFHCVTMPSRFGKTYIADMVAAYYTNEGDSREAFKGLAIESDPSFEKHLNKHNVIKLDIAGICGGRPASELIKRIREKIDKQLSKLFPTEDFTPLSPAEAICELNERLGATFVFVIDEWDYLLRNYPEDVGLFDSYIGLLRSLFKNSEIKGAIDPVYMTGIMPIKRYGSMSALNEFSEFTMVAPDTLAPCFGFSEAEVKKVMEQSGTKLTLAELKEWYDGYRLEGIGEVYCPSSVSEACRRDTCRDYFAGSAAVSAITMGLKNNFISLEKEAAILLSGGSVQVDAREFSSDLSRLDTPNKGLTALIHAGFLRYDPRAKTASIPNREVAIRFYTAVKSLSFKGGLSELAKRSQDLLASTLAMDGNSVAKTFDELHRRLVSLFDKTNEAALSVLASVAYIDASDSFIALKEPNLGLGRADIALLPLRKGENPALVIELKVSDSADSAIEQIKAKEYYKPLEGYYGEVLLVGISFDKDTLKHTCKIERIIKNQ